MKINNDCKSNFPTTTSTQQQQIAHKLLQCSTNKRNTVQMLIEDEWFLDGSDFNRIDSSVHANGDNYGRTLHFIGVY